MVTGNEFFWGKILEHKGSRISWLWPAVVNNIQALKKATKIRIFTNPMTVQDQEMWIERANRLLKYSRKAPGENSLTINYESEGDIMSDLFTMWLDGTHDDYLEKVTFREFIEQGLDTNRTSNSYIKVLKLFPPDVLRTILTMLSKGDFPKHINRVMKASGLSNKNGIEAKGNFEGKIKRNLEKVINDSRHTME